MGLENEGIAKRSSGRSPNTAINNQVGAEVWEKLLRSTTL